MKIIYMLTILTLFFTGFKSINNPTKVNQYSTEEVDLLFSRINKWNVNK